MEANYTFGKRRRRKGWSKETSQQYLTIKMAVPSHPPDLDLAYDKIPDAVAEVGEEIRKLEETIEKVKPLYIDFNNQAQWEERAHDYKDYVKKTHEYELTMVPTLRLFRSLIARRHF